MAVKDFAPAVLALSELIKRANTILNGERDSTVRVLIDVDVEQHCFQFDIEIVHSIWEHAKGLFGKEHIKSAAEIAKRLGVIAGGVAGIVGLIGALKKLRGKAPDSTKMVVREGSNVVQITAGGSVFFMQPEAAKFLTDPAIAQKKVIEPVTQPGYAREMSIADEEWLQQFQKHEIAVPPGSLLDVSIGVSAIKVDSHGEPVDLSEYTILKVHDVTLP